MKPASHNISARIYAAGGTSLAAHEGGGRVFRLSQSSNVIPKLFFQIRNPTLLIISNYVDISLDSSGYDFLTELLLPEHLYLSKFASFIKQFHYLRCWLGGIIP